jgi:hypothetical protein
MSTSISTSLHASALLCCFRASTAADHMFKPGSLFRGRALSYQVLVITREARLI